jgi:serine/threonine protein kinase
VNLPPELSERFVIVEELGSGGEGFVLLVADAAGAEFVVKLYHPNLTFDDKASSLLTNADRAHVLGMELGRTADGSRFEVLEWCELGTLRDVLNNGRRLDVTEVVAELASALEHIHGLRLGDDSEARLVHQDLKPDNVMVRTLEPLDLVLGDFGLARMIAGSRHYTNRQQGSRAWAPPSGEAVTAGWDWWSLGMIVAEVAAGRHPFCVDGEWLSDAAISDHLSQSPVDLSAPCAEAC